MGWNTMLGFLAIIGFSVGLKSNQASMAFFGAGSLFLVGGLFLFRANLAKKEEVDKSFF